MGAAISAVFIILFSIVNLFLWGDSGYIVHLLGASVPAYSLIWIWIGLIAIICGSSYAVDGGEAHPVGYIISIWWAANIGMTTILNAIKHRGVEEAGGTIFGYPLLLMDFSAQAALDLASILLIWVLATKGLVKISAWVVLFCGFLVANLFGHAAGSYNLMIGVGPDITAQSYDAYMYLVFTIMLSLQVIGSGLDVILRWIGTNVDLYRDIRPYLSRIIHRHLHLS